jgi:hypothetical protein
MNRIDRMKKRSIVLLGWLVVLLVACGDAGAGDPAETVEKYFEAKVAADVEGLRQVLCSEMEANLEREVRTFEGVQGVHLEGMVCTQEGTSSTVRCEGSIVALYGTEETEFPLTAYQVVQEDGEWKWCGEAE